MITHIYLNSIRRFKHVMPRMRFKFKTSQLNLSNSVTELLPCLLCCLFLHLHNVQNETSQQTCCLSCAVRWTPWDLRTLDVRYTVVQERRTSLQNYCGIYSMCTMPFKTSTPQIWCPVCSTTQLLLLPSLRKIWLILWYSFFCCCNNSIFKVYCLINQGLLLLLLTPQPENNHFVLLYVLCY